MIKQIFRAVLPVVFCLLAGGCGTPAPTGSELVEETTRRDEEVKTLATPKGETPQ
jgi:hypothetical protein